MAISSPKNCQFWSTMLLPVKNCIDCIPDAKSCQKFCSKLGRGGKMSYFNNCSNRIHVETKHNLCLKIFQCMTTDCRCDRCK